MLAKLKKRLMRRSTKKADGFYKVSDTCQITNLNDLYQLFLGKKDDGFFVEFGAYDGEKFSNTSGLADMGWKGIYIEPIKEYASKCKHRHKKNDVKVINCGISNQKGYTEINIGGPLSTIKDEVAEKFNRMEWSKKNMDGNKEAITLNTLDSVLEKEGAPKNFDVLSVDVEGYEWEALKSFEILKWSPKLIIIELHDNNPIYQEEWENADNIIRYFEENGYRIIYKDFTNTVYVKSNLSQNLLKQ